MNKRKAFTLIELLVVVAIIALLISILLPSLSRARELSKRTVCCSNQRGIGQAFYIYAQDDPGVFPTISANTTDTMIAMFSTHANRIVEPSTTGVPSPTVDMWAVVKANNTTPKQFICPSTSDVPDNAQDPTAYYDFGITRGISYGYQYQHSPNRRPIGTTSEPTFPVLSDCNPYVKGGLTAPGGPATQDRQGSGKGNSFNHTNREGQNVLYQDSHVLFEKGPDCGLSGSWDPNIKSARGRDNIYTTHVYSAWVDAGDKPQSVTWTAVTSDPDGSGFTGTVTVKLAGQNEKSDACLVP